jgi:hypothetical protein
VVLPVPLPEFPNGLSENPEFPDPEFPEPELPEPELPEPELPDPGRVCACAPIGSTIASANAPTASAFNVLGADRMASAF